jgi:hypothetical protein
MARKRIDLQPYRDQGLIDVLECGADEAGRVREKCCRFAELHVGELESLTIMLQPGQNALFCTADGGAIRAAVMLDLSERTVSLEELLRRVNLQRSFEGRELWQFSERKFQQTLKRASIDKIQGLGPDSRS